MAEAKSLTVNNVKYTVKDATARQGVSTNAANITSLTGRVQTLENANFLPSAKIQFVQELPAETQPDVYYFIPEEQ